jgi:hypothetical protein
MIPNLCPETVCCAVELYGNCKVQYQLTGHVVTAPLQVPHLWKRTQQLHLLRLHARQQAHTSMEASCGRQLRPHQLAATGTQQHPWQRPRILAMARPLLPCSPAPGSQELRAGWQRSAAHHLVSHMLCEQHILVKHSVSRASLPSTPAGLPTNASHVNKHLLCVSCLEHPIYP